IDAGVNCHPAILHPATLWPQARTSSACAKRLPSPFVSNGREVFFYGKRNRQVVQRRQGLRFHHARGRLKGRVRPPLEHRRRRLQEPRRRNEGRVRDARRRQGPRGRERRQGRRVSVGGKEEKVEFAGEVMEALSNGKYRVALDNGHEALGYTAG